MSVMPQQQAESEIVAGVIQAIVDRGGGRYQVEVNTGGQNPRRLWSRDLELVQQIAQMQGQHQTFLCGVSHWTGNDGSARRSLWINGMGPGTQMPQQQPQYAPQPQPQQQWTPPQLPTVVQPQSVPMGAIAQPRVMQQPQRVSEEEREMRIMRQTATKVAGILISHVPPDQRTLEHVLQLSDQLVGYYVKGMQQSVPNNPESYDDGNAPPSMYEPHPDDNIPF